MQKPIKTAINTALLLPAPTPADIAQSRREAGLTQAQMATALDLSGASRIAEYESGTRTMSRSLWSLWRLMIAKDVQKDSAFIQVTDEMIMAGRNWLDAHRGYLVNDEFARGLYKAVRQLENPVS